MQRCLLSDIPDARFEAVLRQLSSNYHACLRQVSRSVCKRTTKHVPHLIIRLSNSSSEQQVQQWFEATSGFKHVGSIHVHMMGEVRLDMFDLVMQLLSKRFDKIGELHLLAINPEISSGSRSSTCLPMLLPIKHLISNLETLVIDGIAVEDLTVDLLLLTEAAAKVACQWQLQHLILHAGWSFKWEVLWSDFPAAVDHLIKLFPLLKHASIQVPALEYSSLQFTDGPFADISELWETKMVDVTAVAALGNAVVQHKSLEVLTVSNVPDIWGEGPLTVEHSAVATIESGAAHVQRAFATTDTALSGGLLSTVSAAAKEFASLDDCGCWLLRHHSTLQRLGISTLGTGASMSWQTLMSRRQQQLVQPTSTVPDGAAGAKLLDFKANIRTKVSDLAARLADVTIFSEAGGDENADIRSSGRHDWVRYEEYLSDYTSRQLSTIKQHMSSLQIDAHDDEVNGLTAVLGDLKSLKHLDVSISYEQRGSGLDATDRRLEQHGMVTAKAAAPVGNAVATIAGLQSLTLSFKTGQLDHLPAGLLRPLTADAGGPGCSLKQLKLTAKLPRTVRAQHRPNSAAEIVCFEDIQQLSGLVELSVGCFNADAWQRRTAKTQLGGLCLDNLPGNLQIFTGHSLHIAAQHGSRSRKCAQLRHLNLHHCYLRSPSILAGGQLQQLVIINSNWPGGWTAAAAAWPNVTQLVWRYDENLLCSREDLDRSSSSTMHDTFPSCEPTLQQIFVGFKRLRSLTVVDAPDTIVEAGSISGYLQYHVQYMKQLQYFKLCIARPSVIDEQSAFELDMARYQSYLQRQLPWACVCVTVAEPAE